MEGKGIISSYHRDPPSNDSFPTMSNPICQWRKAKKKKHLPNDRANTQSAYICGPLVRRYNEHQTQSKRHLTPTEQRYLIHTR